MICNDNNNSYINALLPEGYAIHHVDRGSGKRGGGVALINKKLLKLKNTDTVVYKQFKSMMSTLTINNSSFIIYVIYRPPPSQQNGYNVNCFLDEFAEFLSKSTVAKSEIIILGDVNIYLDVKTNTHTRRFIELFERNGFKQHVHESTHYLGHTLDVLITRDTSDIVANVTVTDIGLLTLTLTLKRVYFDNNEYCNLRKKQFLKYIR